MTEFELCPSAKHTTSLLTTWESINRSHFPTVPTDFDNPYRRKNIFYLSEGRNIYFSYKGIKKRWECGNEILKAFVQHGLWRYHFRSNLKLRVGAWEYGG